MKMRKWYKTKPHRFLSIWQCCRLLCCMHDPTIESSTDFRSFPWAKESAMNKCAQTPIVSFFVETLSAWWMPSSLIPSPCPLQIKTFNHSFQLFPSIFLQLTSGKWWSRHADDFSWKFSTRCDWLSRLSFVVYERRLLTTLAILFGTLSPSISANNYWLCNRNHI